MVYCAGPLSADTRDGTIAHVQAAMCAASRLRDAEIAVVLPHLCLFWNDRFPAAYETWLAMDFALLERCDALVRLAPSPGTDREVAHARSKGIPVYLSIDEVLREAAA